MSSIPRHTASKSVTYIPWSSDQEDSLLHSLLRKTRTRHIMARHCKVPQQSQKQLSQKCNTWKYIVRWDAKHHLVQLIKSSLAIKTNKYNTTAKNYLWDMGTSLGSCWSAPLWRRGDFKKSCENIGNASKLRWSGSWIYMLYAAGAAVGISILYMNQSPMYALQHVERMRRTPYDTLFRGSFAQKEFLATHSCPFLLSPSKTSIVLSVVLKILNCLKRSSKIAVGCSSSGTLLGPPLIQTACRESQ